MGIWEYVIIVLGVTAVAAVIAPGKRSRIAVLIIVPLLGLAFFLLMLALYSVT